MTRFFFRLFLLSAALFWSALALAQDVVPEIGEQIGAVIDAARAGQWVLFSALIVWVVVWVLQQKWFFDALWHKVPKRVRVVIPLVLGAAAGVLASIAGGLPWQEALTIGLVSGPAAITKNELLWKAIFGTGAKKDG